MCFITKLMRTCNRKPQGVFTQFIFLVAIWYMYLLAFCQFRSIDLALFFLLKNESSEVFLLENINKLFRLISVYIRFFLENNSVNLCRNFDSNLFSHHLYKRLESVASLHMTLLLWRHPRPLVTPSTVVYLL